MASVGFNIFVFVVLALIVAGAVHGCSTGAITASDFDLPLIIIRAQDHV